MREPGRRERVGQAACVGKRGRGKGVGKVCVKAGGVAGGVCAVCVCIFPESSFTGSQFCLFNHQNCLGQAGGKIKKGKRKGQNTSLSLNRRHTKARQQNKQRSRVGGMEVSPPEGMR